MAACKTRSTIEQRWMTKMSMMKTSTQNLASSRPRRESKPLLHLLLSLTLLRTQVVVVVVVVYHSTGWTRLAIKSEDLNEPTRAYAICTGGSWIQVVVFVIPATCTSIFSFPIISDPLLCLNSFKLLSFWQASPSQRDSCLAYNVKSIVSFFHSMWMSSLLLFVYLAHLLLLVLLFLMPSDIQLACLA